MSFFSISDQFLWKSYSSVCLGSWVEDSWIGNDFGLEVWNEVSNVLFHKYDDVFPEVGLLSEEQALLGDDLGQL